MAQVLNVENQPRHFQFNVKMSCSGCSGAVQRALDKSKSADNGVKEFTVSLPDQTVDVWGTIAYVDLLAIIEKTGKQVLDGKEVLDEKDVQDGKGVPLPDTVELTV